MGYGSDGTVWRSQDTAIKAIHRAQNYLVERVSYERLRAANVDSIGPFAVPRMIDSDDHLQIIEMEIVEPPYILDFGKVHIDAPPVYWSDRQLRENVYVEWKERFDSHWQQVASAMRVLEKHGIFYVDPRPSNIDTTGLA